MLTQHTTRPSLRPALVAAFALGLLAAPASAQTLVENFDGAALNTETWTSRVTNTNGSVSVADGTLTMNAGALTTSQRATIITNASNFNPFANPVTLTFGGLGLAGTAVADEPNWGNTFYTSIGRATTDIGTLDPAVAGKYSAVGNDYAGAIGLNIRHSTTSYLLQIVDRGTSGVSGATPTTVTTAFTISAMPTNLVWVVDGTGAGSTWSVTLSGATFDGGLSTMSGTFYKFSGSDLVSGSDSISRLAIGAINVGGSSTKPMVSPTVVTLDSVSVGAIPEPASFALLLSGVAGAVTISRRRLVRAGR